MIIFRSVKYKNILSTGNAWTEIPLDTHKSTLIIGTNGAGKSTVLDAICFALYGKPFRKINKPQLVNIINQKQLEVVLTFDIGPHNYIIRRGIKPNIFEICVDGKVINQDAASKDYQAYLEQSILKMNYKSFGQIVVLGSSTFVPFMQLSAQNRREVIEDLLDIQVFSVMNSILKTKMTNAKDSMKDIKHEIEMMKQKIISAKEHNESIKLIKEKEVDKIKDKIKEQLQIIDTNSKNILALEKDINSLLENTTNKNKLLKEKENINNERITIKNSISQLTKENSFYHKHDNCPTCKQGIAHDFKEEIVNKNVLDITSLENDLVNNIKEDKRVASELDIIANIEKDISDKKNIINEHNIKINLAKSILKKLKKEYEEAESDIESISIEKITMLEIELSDLEKAKEKLTNDIEVMTHSATILKDTGIKSKIIKQYVPIINKLINTYLSEMGFFVEFQLDENFNETIKSRFRDEFSYDSFSEGEKLRIDLALLFTWRSVSKLRNSVTTNLLIMDEIMDSSLDNSGTDDFLKIINDLTTDTNVFIISHKGEQLYEKFDHLIKFEKHKNFSRISS